MKQKAVIRRKKKIAAATYLYQADCDDEWGEIYIDFVNKAAKIGRSLNYKLYHLISLASRCSSKLPLSV